MPELSQNAITVLERRYLKKDRTGKIIETPDQMFHRVARTIASAEKNYANEQNFEQIEQEFYSIMSRREFLPNSPTLMNAGRELAQLSACFVLPVEDSMESIFEAVKYTALIHKSGGGTGFSFSRIRPKNDIVQSTKGVSSGPISFMSVFDAATEAIKQGGTRRGANMAILKVDHPDILEFVTAKQENNRLNNFNISVGVTDKFMQAVEANEDYPLINPRTNEVADHLNAREVFDKMVTLAWKNGDPGIIFLDRINAENPTPHVGAIESTNPCGEQPLLPYESCNLGSINLVKFVTNKRIDYDRLKEVVHIAVRFLDNVIDVNQYPLPQIAEVTRANRKIGLGIMGFADMLFQMEIPYNSDKAVKQAETIMKFIKIEADSASEALAKERGCFDNFAGSRYDRKGAAALRNATRTTIAPTGTISIIAGCSSGIEPLFALSFVRNVMDDDKLLEVHPYFERVAKENGFYSDELMQKISENGTLHGLLEVPEKIQKVFVTAHDISPEWHIKMQAAFQKSTDNAVSKTVNFPNSATVDDVRNVYRMAYESGCKGVTIYRDGSRDVQVLTKGKSNDAAAAKSEQPEPNRRQPRKRPQVLSGTSFSIETGCGTLYVTINDDANGMFELFNTMGKAGGCAASQSEAIGRLVSLCWRSGISPQEVSKQLVGISCHRPKGFGSNKVLSCADAIAKAINQHLNQQNEVQKSPITAGACPDCGGPLEHEGGCAVCHSCGFSECG
ncbi:vitamin B12-dependent ribonucleotide reductase [candidate division KSB1 bacterium]|nr:vitamin B12-dependent ribonucleotide reductase [candidate division KSB1 bacterium]